MTLTNLSISRRDISHVSINNIRTTAWVISVSRPDVCTMSGHVDRYRNGIQLEANPNGLNINGSKNRTILVCFGSIQTNSRIFDIVIQ